MLKTAYFLLLILLMSSCQNEACEDLDSQNCSVLKDFVVFDQNRSLNFRHICSEVEHKSPAWQAYAFFENTQGKNYKALVLAEVSVGWIRGPIGPNGIDIQIEKFQIESLSSWAGKNFSLALQVTNRRTGQNVIGDFSKSFSFSKPGRRNDEQRNYSLSEKGDFEWERFIEPEEKKSKETAYRHHEAIQVIADNIPHPEDPQALSVVLKSSSGQSRLAMKGPVLNDLKSRLKIENQQAQTLGFWQTMNPYQKGGLWHWFREGYHYKDCIFLRKKAKKEFDRRFSG